MASPESTTDDDPPDTTVPTKLTGWNPNGYDTDHPTPDGDRHYLLDDTAGAARITHPLSFQKAGFDLTEFASADSFRALLKELDLPSEPDIVDRYPDSTDNDHVAFVWANESLVIVTGANPLTGEHGWPDVLPKDEGYASSIGIEGVPQAVEEAFTLISRRGSTDGGRNRTRREYI